MKDYKKYFTIQAEAEELYKALTNPTTIRLWSGEDAIMSTEVNSEFSLWEGSIVGKNLEFIDNKLIKQQWYFEGQSEPSIVTIKIHPTNEMCSVELRHINIPDEAYNEIVEGWNENYFGSLIDFYSF